MTLSDLPTWFVRTFAVAFGLIWGSFANVVICRLPRGMSVAHPPSHCPACGNAIAPFDNIPVVSFLLLRGRARCCRTRLSFRYPLVELIGGALSLAIVEVVIFQLAGSTPLGRAVALYLIDFALALALVSAAFIDAETMILPDSITLGGTALAIATCTLRGLPMIESLFGAAISFFIVWFPFIFAYRRIRGFPGMGLGDAKLMALVGGWFGYRGALFVLFAGAIQGTLFALVTFLLRGRIDEPEAVLKERAEMQAAADAGDEEARQLLVEDPIGREPEPGLRSARIAFGPCLILGAIEYLLGAPFIDRLLSWAQ